MAPGVCIGHSVAAGSWRIGQFAISLAAGDACAWQHAAAGTNIKATICQVSANDATTLARARKTRILNVMVTRAAN